MRRFLISAAAMAAMVAPGFAQSYDAATGLPERVSVSPQEAARQDYCITVMGAFPPGNNEARYQFFKLVSDMGADATPQFQDMITAYGENAPSADTPLLDVIDVIANPVIRQAAPEIVVANMGHLIAFNSKCEASVQGQIFSLTAADSSLFLSDEVIAEDALYLRQILSESLGRLGAADDPVHSDAARAYARALITTRDAVEYAAFETEIDDLEAMFMTDLDGRLARSNDIINEEANREILDDAVILAEDMNRDAEDKQKARDIETLFRILGGY